jgi:hypothetical protein
MITLKTSGCAGNTQQNTPSYTQGTHNEHARNTQGTRKEHTSNTRYMDEEMLIIPRCRNTFMEKIS